MGAELRNRLVIALGGNALIERNHSPDVAPQLANVRRAVESLAPLVPGNDLVITHGNGPQVGLLALESAADSALAVPYPLDALVAETQGLIGYWLIQALRNIREVSATAREVAGLVTQVVVDLADPAFGHPTKFIGPLYNADDASRLAATRGVTVAADGDRWRRVVASPEPREVVEIALVSRLVEAGTIVVCGGGGGIPVARDGAGVFEGVEAVIDKDLTSALIAESIGADTLILLTDVPAVSTDFGRPGAEVIRRATPDDLRSLDFAAGSMGPKVAAVCRFVERTGGMDDKLA